jgi:septal ring-binding cell division protein DamX
MTNRGWTIVLGADASAAEAQAEIGKATRAGLQAGKIYLWQRSAKEARWFVPTAGPYASEAAARQGVPNATKAVGRDVSVADLSTWCSKSVARSGYDECVE